MHRNALLLAVALLAFGSASEAGQPAAIRFNRDIRPIFSDNCYACHGPDKNKRESDLRLDVEKGAFAKLDDHYAIVPGKPEESRLIRRITSTDEDEHMPPPKSGKKLTAEQIDLLRRWIAGGAKWEAHWSLLPIERPALPALPAGAAVRNSIDRFSLARLAELGMQPSPEADRITLIRRLRFDLTGLPPTREEVDAFIADSGPDAYERLVDRLLASPQHGERMAMWWLDLVRYADSVGYHGDQPVSIFPFRQYVIDAFNANKRFDQFTIEQLAGDLLADPTPEQKIASGYNRLGMMSAEGGVQDKEYLAKYIAERVRNASGTWLGATLGCCECHNHKYDPFTTKDFYRFEAFFADIQERGFYGGAEGSGEWGPRMQVPSPEQARQKAQLDGQIAEARRTVDAQTPELAAAQEQWEKSQVVWTVLKPASQTSASGATLAVRDDGSILASGPAPPTDTYTLVVKDPPRGAKALRLEALPDDSLPKKGPGRFANGNFVLSELTVKLKPTGDEPEQPITLQNASATYEQTGHAEGTPSGKWAAADAINGRSDDPGEGWAILEQTGRPQHAVFETTADLSGGEGTALTVTLAQNHNNPGHTLGRFRISATTSPRPVRAGQSAPEPVAGILAVAPASRSEEQRKQLSAYFRSITPLLASARDKLMQLEQARAALDKQIPTTLVTVMAAPRTIRVLARGNWMDDSGEVVQPGVPACLPQPPPREGRLTRLDLAKWLVARENPLTARTLANRLWKLYFGAGLSRKVEDLGAQGESPSHPEMLDWLASELIDSGWDVRRLAKLIVMSGTYRQSSLAGSKLREADPYNRWLARQGRFRLDAEMVRDNALAVSGLLVEKLGGPSVKPYQPPGYWDHLNFPQREWQNGTGDEIYRRGLYTHWQRQYLHPSLLAFDAPSREECTADRPRSNTPLQSLVLLNDPTYVEAARALAELTIRHGGAETGQRLDWVFRRVLSRPIKPAEATVLAGLLDKHLAEYRQNAAAAAEVLRNGAKPAAADLDKAELAAWTSVARAVLNLHEAIVRN